MDGFLALYGVFGMQIFFNTMELLGKSYQNSTENKSYIIYTLIFAAIIFIKYFLDVVKERKMEPIEIIIIGILIAFILLLYSRGYLEGRFDIEHNMTITNFGARVVPSVICALYLARKGTLTKVVPWLDILMLLFTFSTAKVAIVNILSGTMYQDSIKLGGAGAQAIAYYGAIAFGINLLFIINREKLNILPAFRKTWFMIIRIILCIVQISSVLLSGGRGGMVFCMVIIGYALWNSFLERKTLFRNIAIFTVGIIVFIYYIFPTLMQIPLFENGFSRAFAFLSSSGIDWSGSSNRDTVYTQCIDLIKTSPIIGTGMFKYFYSMGMYPHNIFLETMLEGGIFYLTIIVTILVKTVKKIIELAKKDFNNYVLLFFLLYVMTFLSFSGTYSRENIIWFVVSYVFTSKELIKEDKIGNIRKLGFG